MSSSMELESSPFNSTGISVLSVCHRDWLIDWLIDVDCAAKRKNWCENLRYTGMDECRWLRMQNPFEVTAADRAINYTYPDSACRFITSLWKAAASFSFINTWKALVAAREFPLHTVHEKHFVPFHQSKPIANNHLFNTIVLFTEYSNSRPSHRFRKGLSIGDSNTRDWVPLGVSY